MSHAASGSTPPSAAEPARGQRFPWAPVAGVLLGAGFYFIVVCGLRPVLFPEAWIGRVMSSWINLMTFVAFAMAMMMLLDRWLILRREEKGFSLLALGADSDALLLPEDALEQRKKLRQLKDPQNNLVVVRLFSAALQRARANWSAEDTGEAVCTQAELLQGEHDAEYSMLRYLAWAIPSIGFIGTVLGIGSAMAPLKGAPDAAPAAQTAAADTAATPAGDAGAAAVTPLEESIGYLHTAFDTTFVALILSLVVMYFMYRMQARDDLFLVRATDWCMQRFVFRMHIPKDS